MIFLYRKDDGKGDFSVNAAEKSSFFVYASSEKNRMLACRFGEHRDNSRNSQSVFLVVYVVRHPLEDASGRFCSYKIFLK